MSWCWILVVACGIFNLLTGAFPRIPSSQPELNPGPLQWEHGVLATEPPGKSLGFLLEGLLHLESFQRTMLTYRDNLLLSAGFSEQK